MRCSFLFGFCCKNGFARFLDYFWKGLFDVTDSCRRENFNHSTRHFAAPDTITRTILQCSTELTSHFEEHMRELSTELSHVTTEESTVVTPDDPLEKLESPIGTIKPKYYHVDEWQLDEASYKLVRIHKRPRRSLFTPGPGCPVELNQLSGVRTTYLDYGQGKTDKIVDFDFKKLSEHFLLNSPPPSRRYLTKGPPPGVPTPASEAVSTEQVQDTEVTEDTSRKSRKRHAEELRYSLNEDVIGKNWRPNCCHVLRNSSYLRVKLTELFFVPDPTTGEQMTGDYWFQLPIAWVRFHYQLSLTSLTEDQLRTNLVHCVGVFLGNHRTDPRIMEWLTATGGEKKVRKLTNMK